MTRAGRSAIALLAAGLASAAAATGARGAVIASSVTGFEGGPALASDGRIVVGERRGDGALRILAIDPRTRAVTQLAAFPPLADATTYPELNLTGSGGIVTASLDVYRQVLDPGEEMAMPALLSSRTMTILPAVSPLGACGIGPKGYPELDAAGGEDFVATIGDECALTPRAVRIRTARGTVTIAARDPAPDARFPAFVAGLRATGPMVSWVETVQAAVGPARSTLVVMRASSATELLRLPIVYTNRANVGLGADGTVAAANYADPAACALDVASPARPARSLAMLPDACPGISGGSRGQPAVAIAGGRIVFPTFGGYAVSDLSGDNHRLGERAGAGLLGSAAVALDGHTAFAMRRDCDADRLLAIDVTLPSTAPAAPGVAGPCRVRRGGPSRLRVARDGRVTIALRCPSGCRATLRIVQQRRGRRERLVGSADYAGASGAVGVRVPVARYAQRLAGCRGGLRVEATLFAVGRDQTSAGDGRGTGLGSYRIVSGSPCRRGGGPAFAAPLPGPRP